MTSHAATVKHLAADRLSRFASIAVLVAYAIPINMTMPEWTLPARFYLPAMALFHAFAMYGSKEGIRLSHFVKILLSMTALCVQASCFSETVAEMDWGEANGCAHHSVAKIIILAFNVCVDVTCLFIYLWGLNKLQ